MPTRRTLTWLLAASLYASLCLWYTDCGGPLSADEQDRFAQELSTLGFDGERMASIRRFMERDTGRQFFMINVLDMADDPPDVEGAPAGASAETLMGLYMEHMYRELLKRACHPVLFGNAIHRSMDLVGIEGAEQWTAGAVMRYRSRRSFLEIVTLPETHERHEFKVAALDKTIAFPVETQLNLGDPRVLVGLALLCGVALADIAIWGRRG